MSQFYLLFADGGRCIAFNPGDDAFFLIGTEEGIVYRCTTEYSTFLDSYIAHNVPVYNICWNTYVPTIFITCAAEWTVKIWNQNSQ